MEKKNVYGHINEYTVHYVFLISLFKGSVLNNPAGESPGSGKTSSKVHQNYEGTN